MRVAIPRINLCISLAGLLLVSGFAVSPFHQWQLGVKNDTFAGEMLIVIVGYAVASSLTLHVLKSEFPFFIWGEGKKFDVELAERQAILIGPLRGLHQKSIYADITSKLPKSIGREAKFFRLGKNSPLTEIVYEVTLLSNPEGHYSEIAKSTISDCVYSINSDRGNESTAPFWESAVNTELFPLFMEIKVVKIIIPDKREKSGSSQIGVPKDSIPTVWLKGKLRVGVRTPGIFNFSKVSIREAEVKTLDTKESMQPLTLLSK